MRAYELIDPLQVRSSARDLRCQRIPKASARDPPAATPSEVNRAISAVPSRSASVARGAFARLGSGLTRSALGVVLAAAAAVPASAATPQGAIDRRSTPAIDAAVIERQTS